MNKFIQRILFPVVFLLATQYCLADEFDKYRNVIDNYPSFTFEQREASISELEGSTTPDTVEKDYLLGMLSFIQGIDLMQKIAKSKPKQLAIKEVVADKEVSRYLNKAEGYYDKVNMAHPGYKYIYCKYGELYRYSANGEGLERITKEVGGIQENDRLKQCKALLEDIAEMSANYGQLLTSINIYKAAVSTWKDYPKYMLEAIGGLENALHNRAEAKIWWKRCKAEATGERKSRCSSNLKNPEAGIPD